MSENTTSSAAAQAELSTFTAGTTTEEVVQTVQLELETSQTKTEKVRQGVDEFQRIARYFSDLMPSIPEHERTRNNPAFYNLVQKKFDDTLLKKSVARDAAYHAIEVWDSYTARGSDGDRPTLGSGSYMELCNQDFELVDNDGGGYGIQASFIPRDRVWFGISLTPYARDYLERIFEGDADTGSCELRLSDDGRVSAHLVVKWPVEVYNAGEVATTIGVDIGESVIYAAAVVDGEGAVETAEMKSGDEFRHYREQFKQKRKRLNDAGDLRGLKQCRNEHERYTQQVLDTASREIVKLAVDHAPAVLVLEDLTHYRETAREAIHDWPYADLQQKISYKATAEGIPVAFVDPHDTSITCRQCGQTTREFRDGDDFACRRCGYEVHADVNAAINIAQKHSA